MLPEPYRSQVKGVALINVLDVNDDALTFVFIYFNDWDEAQVFHENFYEGVSDLVSFPGGWYIIGDIIIVQMHS